MISGNKRRPVSEYLLIDHCKEGFGYSTPGIGEEFWGYPWGWAEGTAPPYIEVERDGVVIRSVNALDVSEILFADEATPTYEKGKTA